MKKSLILLPLAAVLLSLTGCKKDNEKSGSSGETVTFTANIGGGEKTEIYDGTKMKWSYGDKITINGDVFTSDFPMGDYTTANFVGTFTTPAPTEYKAYYPQTLYDEGSDKYVLPATQTYNGSTLSGINPMYAYQSDVDNKTLQFHNICALVKLKVTGTGTVKQIVVTSMDNLCGEFSVVKDSGKYYAEISGSGSTTLTLNCGTGVELSDEPTTFYIALPQGTLRNLKFKIGKYSDIIMTAELTAGKLYTKTLENVEAPSDEFTVGMDGGTPRKVRFAPGNLYYNGEDGDEMNAALPSGWNFYEHQWDCYPSGTLLADESMEINLFTWGYGEWSTVYNTTTYQTGDAMEDWGRVAIGSDPANTWRTLSGAEWEYLLKTRTNATKLRGCVTLIDVGVSGLVILPDGTKNVMIEYDIYRTSDLVTYGAVFLPAAGYRYGTGVCNGGYFGYYWSSTPDGSFSAYDMRFDSYDVCTYNDSRDCGIAVRLVR